MMTVRYRLYRNEQRSSVGGIIVGAEDLPCAFSLSALDKSVGRLYVYSIVAFRLSYVAVTGRPLPSVSHARQ